MQAEGPPLLDTDELGALVGLLRGSALAGVRPSLTRVLSNLCSHGLTRKTLLTMLLGTLQSATTAAAAAAPGSGAAAGGLDAAGGSGAQVPAAGDMEVEVRWVAWVWVARRCRLLDGEAATSRADSRCVLIVLHAPYEGLPPKLACDLMSKGCGMNACMRV